MRRRVILIAALITALALAVPTAVIYCAAFTQEGLRFIVNRVPQRIGGVRLTFVNVRGTLAHGFSIERLEIDQERVYLRFEDVRARIDLGSLLWQSIRAPQASAHSAFIQVKPHKEEPPSADPHFLPHGLVIRADQVHADAATLVLPNGQRIEGTQIDTAGFIRRRTIRILNSALTMGSAQLTGESALGAANPLTLSASVHVALRNPSQPPWIFSATAHGDLNVLPLTVGLTAPFRADFQGEARQLTAHWNWSGNAKVAEFDLRAWGGGNALGLTSGELALTGDAAGFSARGTVTPAGLGAGAFDALFEGAYADRVLTAQRIEVTHHASGAHATGAGTIGIVDNGPRLDLKGSWREFRWPLVGASIAVRSAAGDYALSGRWPYDLSGSAVVTVRGLAAMPVRMEAKLAKDRLIVRSAQVKALDGQASVSGEVVWAPGQSWSVAGNAAGINPGKLRPDLPGTLNFGFSAAGEGFTSDADYSVELKGIGGRLRGHAARGGGKLARRGKAWVFQDVRVGLGQTNVALDGKVAEELALKFTVDATDMSLLAPESRGELHAHGTLGGTRRLPALTLSAHGKGIHHDGMSLDSIEAQVAFDMGAARRSKIDLHARNFTYQERKLTALDLTVDGTTASHVMRLDAKAVGLAVQLQAAGGVIHDMWQGQLTTFNVDGNESLHLVLEAPIGLLASADHVRIDKLCVHGQPGRMCMDADWTHALWSANLAAQDLPMSTLTAGLTPSLEYRGRLSVTASAAGAAAQPLTGSLRADLVDARLSHHAPSGKIELIKLGTGVVTINATHAAIATEVSFDAGDVGTIKGRANIVRTTPQWQDMPLEGEVHAQTAELGYVTLYFPEIDKASGKLDANLAITGTLGTPLIEGSIKLSNTELDFFQVSLALRQTELEAKLHDNVLDFTGSAHIGQGALSAHGGLLWRDSLPYGQFHLEGTELRVADIPEAQIDAAPNLDFTIKGRQITVTGNVKVPYAKIVPADLTGAVRPSSDEVLVGKEPEDLNKRFEVTSDITLSLGDKVSIDTLGLKARLTGSIAVRSGHDNATSGTGELLIEDGKYSAYGRQLDIQRGRLIFNGGDVEDPGIDIRAVKVFPDVTAGINVRGSLRQPRISYFSDPSLSQSQILSLLLAGGSLESVQNRQNAAASQLLAQGGAILAQQFGSKVGIQDVGLESDLSNETSLVLGRYLSPRLYVSYGVSLTQQLNTVKARYSLSDRWTIKTEAGQARGADLVYTIQK
jgi:translocation and assembly module TamB